MKKIIFIIYVFLFSINIFAKTGVEKQVQKIREEFTKINSEKNYKVESIYDVSGEILMEYYRKNGELKKVIRHLSIPIKDVITEYYLNDDKVFFVYSSDTMYEMDENGMPDYKKFKKIEKRYYFNKENLIRYIENGKIYDKANIPERSRYIEDDVEILKTTLELEEERKSLN